MLQIIIITVLLAADQLTKFLIFPYLETLPGQTLTVIPGVLDLTYIKNTGASFGMLQGMQWLFIPVTIIVLAAAVYVMVKYRRKHSRYVKVCIAVLFAGALGNLVDRIAFGYVRDFFDIKLFDFWKWVFNVADASLVIGAILLGVYLIFFYRETPKPAVQAQTGDNVGEPDDGADGNG